MKRRFSAAGLAGARLSRHREFLGHVATLMSGKAFAGLVAIFTMPIISRLFMPEHFGVMALFSAIISMIAAIATLNYQAAVVLPEKEDEAILLVALAWRVLILVSGLMLAVIVSYEVSGVSWATLELLGNWKWLLPGGLLLASGLGIQENWLARSKSFRLISVSLVAGNASTGASRILFGLLGGSTVFGLITGYLLGMIVRIAVQWSRCEGMLRSAIGGVSMSTLRDVGQRYSDFPIYNTPAGAVYKLGQELPVLLFGVMFSPAAAGFYAMAKRLTSVPINMVADSVRRVFLQKAASIHRQGGSLKKAYLLSTSALFMGGLPGLLVLWNFGQPLATWFLGDRWFEAGLYIEIISPWLFMVWLMAPCKSVYIVLRQQRLFLFMQVIHTVLRLGVFGAAYQVGAGAEWTLQMFVIVTVLGNVITIFGAFFLITRHSVPPRISPPRQ